MRNWIKPVGLIFITILYCSTLSVSNGLFNNPANFESDQTSSYSSNICKKNLFHTAPSEGQISSIKNNPYASVKKTFDPFSDFFTRTEHLLESKFSKYTSFFFVSAIEFQKFKIIFPFHSFW